MRQKVEFYEQIIQHEEKYFLWYHTTEAESDRSSRTSEGSSGINDDYYFRRQKSIRKGQLPVAAQIDHSNRYFSDSSKRYQPLVNIQTGFLGIPSLTYDLEYFMDLDQFKIGKKSNWMDSIPDNSSEDSMESSEVSSSDYSVDSSTEKVSISSSLMTKITKLPISKTVVSV